MRRVPSLTESLRAAPGQRGSVLIIVLWVAFGLVSLALYFAHSMGMEARGSDNRCAQIQAIAAIRGAACYVTNILATAEEPGKLPDPMAFRCESVPVGEATFWLIGRRDQQMASDRVVFSLADEAAKLDLNTATAAMLELLPRMTAELAAAIVDWRDADSEVTSGGAEDEIYLRLTPAYHCKNAAFESVEELRLVYGMTMEILYGEDANLNGVLEPNENDGDESPPLDNRDGRLDPGLMEYLTIYTRPPALRPDGTEIVNVSSGGGTNLQSLLEEKLGSSRAEEVMARLRPTTSFGGLLQFYAASGMTADEFELIEADITASTNTAAGLINVNTAPEAVLACVPGIGLEQAPALVARRQSNPIGHASVAWVAEVLDTAAVEQAGAYLTGRSFQYAADIAAVGRFGRGWQRVRYVVDTAAGASVFVGRRDLSMLGWALGQDIRTNLISSANLRR